MPSRLRTSIVVAVAASLAALNPCLPGAVAAVARTSIVSTIAGNGTAGFAGDGGPATSARIRHPKSVALYGSGLYISGTDHKVRRIDLTTGIITRVAGTGTIGYSGDGGPALQARLNGPQRLQIDSQGNVYVADMDNHAIRRIEAATGVIRTVAGVGGVAGLRGDDGPATSALLKAPRGIALEGDGILYIADTGNHRVRVVNLRTGTISTVVGTSVGYSGDGGPAGSARLRQPRGLAVTPQGDLLIAEAGNSVIRKVAGTVT